MDVDFGVRLVMHGESQGIAGAAVDFHQFAVFADADDGVVDVFLKTRDDNVLEIAAESRLRSATDAFGGGDHAAH